MSVPTNQKLLDRWREEPAPLLPLLHAFHERDGCLSEESVRAISAGLRIPLAELFGSITFYHHLSREPGGRSFPRVCTGPICRLRGAAAVLDGLEGAVAIPCPGRCDEPIPVLIEDRVLCGLSAETLAERASPLPPPAPDGTTECVFSAIREPGRDGLEGYRRTGGYRGLEAVLERMEPADVLDLIDASGLAGRGGAGFPTGRKWRAVSQAPGREKFVVCNADEGEPGCFKDRAIMDHDPHALIEGMLAAAYATGASVGFVYLRYEYPATHRILARALAEAEEAGLLGERILGRDFRFRIHLRRGAGAYICGEETALLNSLEGKHPFPRNRPPFPVTHGYRDLPTAVNNVETLATVPHILAHGAQWYRGLGVDGRPGTKLISLSGDIRRPGNYEVPMGLPLRTLLQEWAGGAPESREVLAVTMAGLSGGFLAGPDLEVSLDEAGIREKGALLGAGGIMVFDDSRDMMEVARSAMEFFAEESCGKCFPCRIGTRRLVERLNGGGPSELGEWLDEVADLGRTMKETSACGLGQAAPLITSSLVEYFPDQVERHVRGRIRPDGKT
ncbi:MAG: NADH-ubiquinone oxidoreductase-F iron-sulfur binding region domain-containing protein [Gemmatimonadota bacterium]